MSPVPGRSILITSAPKSPRYMVQNGPARASVMSRTRALLRTEVEFTQSDLHGFGRGNGWNGTQIELIQRRDSSDCSAVVLRTGPISQVCVLFTRLRELGRAEPALCRGQDVLVRRQVAQLQVVEHHRAFRAVGDVLDWVGVKLGEDDLLRAAALGQGVCDRIDDHAVPKVVVAARVRAHCVAPQDVHVIVVGAAPGW